MGDLQDDKDKVYFQFSATLRISGEGIDTEEISANLGLMPTHKHNKNEIRNALSTIEELRIWQHDMWSYKSPVSKDKPLETVRPLISGVLSPNN